MWCGCVVVPLGEKRGQAEGCAQCQCGHDQVAGGVDAQHGSGSHDRQQVADQTQVHRGADPLHTFQAPVRYVFGCDWSHAIASSVA